METSSCVNMEKGGKRDGEEDEKEIDSWRESGERTR
jgi:hypothetical protein